MKKAFIGFALLAQASLLAVPAPQFLHRSTITRTSGADDKAPEYLARFKIDKIVDDKGTTTDYTAPQVLCQIGQEAVVTKTVGGDSYIVKVLLYKTEKMVRAKTVIVILENHECVFTSAEEFDVAEK